MKIIKKFNQYVKENLSDMDSDIETDSDLDLDSKMDMDLIDDIKDDNNDIDYEDDEDEIESHQYIGTQMLNELADKLGVEVINNEINYEDKKVNYFSETECFHIGDEKFDNVEDAYNYLTNDESIDDIG